MRVVAICFIAMRAVPPVKAATGELKLQVKSSALTLVLTHESIRLQPENESQFCCSVLTLSSAALTRAGESDNHPNRGPFNAHTMSQAATEAPS